MNKIKNVLARYKFFVVLAIINIAVMAFYPSVGNKSIQITWNNTKEMLAIIPPIFILLGLLDVWVKRETMVKYMGEGSGVIGILLAYFLGSAAAGPLYAAFPVAGVLLKKGSKLSNVLIMLGAWSTTKIPLLLFEASSMGVKFTILRLTVNLFGIAFIAFFTERLLNKSEVNDIYKNVIVQE